MDFKEINAAQHSGVENARLIAAPEGWGEAPPSVARRRVTLIDEAHRLSASAWDVYLKPLEQKIDYSAYLFVTSEGQSIPATIRSRCVRVRFSKVSEDAIFGLLTATAGREGVPYETEALRVIAHRSDGAPRNAMEYFGRVASLGKVTTEFVNTLIDDTLENKCMALWTALVTKKQDDVTRLVSELVGSNTPSAVIESMTTSYSDAVRDPGTELQKIIREVYANLPATTAFFLKWLAVGSLPADAVQLFAYELMLLSPRVAKMPETPPTPAPVLHEPEKKVVSAEELFR